VESISGGVYRANAEQNALLREQNSLLRAILAKNSSITLDGVEVSRVLLPHLKKEEERVTPNLQIAKVRG